MVARLSMSRRSELISMTPCPRLVRGLWERNMSMLVLRRLGLGLDGADRGVRGGVDPGRGTGSLSTAGEEEGAAEEEEEEELPLGVVLMDRFLMFREAAGGRAPSTLAFLIPLPSAWPGLMARNPSRVEGAAAGMAAPLWLRTGGGLGLLWPVAAP